MERFILRHSGPSGYSAVAGIFTLEDGTLLAKSEKGRITARLYRHAGQNDRVLKAEGGSGDGITYHAELTPARRRPAEALTRSSKALVLASFSAPTVSAVIRIDSPTLFTDGL